MRLKRISPILAFLCLDFIVSPSAASPEGDHTILWATLANKGKAQMGVMFSEGACEMIADQLNACPKRDSRIKYYCRPPE